MKNLILFILICLNAPIQIQIPFLMSDLFKKQSIIELIVNLIFFIIAIICFVCNVKTRTNISLFLIQFFLLKIINLHNHN